MNRLLTQRGGTLVFALVLLLIVTLLGLASIRGVSLQEHMASNLYDRDVAFQAAEAALRSGEAAITASASPAGMVDCSAASGTACLPVPASTFQNDNTAWTSIDASFAVNTSVLQGTPQYHIELMGSGNGASQLGQQNSANAAQYGFNGGTPTEQYYRVTARSSNPAAAQDRSVVVLQSTVKRNI